MAAPHYHILPQQQLSNDEDTDYILYPPEPNMFQPQPFVFNGNMADFNIDNQESFPATTGFNSTTMYAEAPQFGLNGKQSPILCDLESPELRAPPSNYSTASGASATSSVMGSPHSMYGSVPVGDWTSTNALGITPSIAQYDSFGNSNDFHFPGVDGDFPMDFTAGQTKSFVGESKTISKSASRLRNSISSISGSNPASLSSLSSFTSSPRAGGTSSPITPLSASRMHSKDECFPSPMSFSSPPSARRASQASSSPVTSSSMTSRPPSSGVSPTLTQSSTFSEHSHSTYQSPFFSQSSGNFVPPLHSSCSFPLSQ